MCRVDYAESDGEWLVPMALHKARKDHVCGDCRRTIARGEYYRNGKYVYDGCVMTEKECQHCWQASRWLNKVCGGSVLGEINDELAEHYRDEPDLRSRGLLWLIVAGRQRWHRDNGQGGLIPWEAVKVWTEKALARTPAEAMH